MDEKYGYKVEWMAVGKEDPHPNIVTGEEREVQEELVKALNQRVDQTLRAVLMDATIASSADVVQEVEKVVPVENALTGLRVVAQAPDPEPKRLPEPREKRGNTQQAKTRKPTNREKRKAADARRKARRQ